MRLHVAAKRYLCAVDPAYASTLSAASIHTLKLQGGPMGAEEVRQFRESPFHEDAVKVRLWDDRGKVPGARTRAFVDYEPLLRRVIARAARA